MNVTCTMQRTNQIGLITVLIIVLKYGKTFKILKKLKQKLEKKHGVKSKILKTASNNSFIEHINCYDGKDRLSYLSDGFGVFVRHLVLLLCFCACFMLHCTYNTHYTILLQ